MAYEFKFIQLFVDAVIIYNISQHCAKIKYLQYFSVDCKVRDLV